MDFTASRKYPYKAGRIFLGRSVLLKRKVGVETERHAIAIAGARSGKGVGLILQNLMRWPDNTLTIDPKGEAAETAIKWREALGQACHVVDPFHSARVDDRHRAQYNPLDDLNPDSLSIREDIQAISDGIVMRSDPHSANWDNGAQAIISGLIGYVKTRSKPDRRNLLEVRAVLINDDRFAQAMEEMEHMDECAGVCRSAHATAFAKEGAYYVSNARSHTRWLDSKGMAYALSKSTFSLNDLKRKDCSVFLVLPANYLGEHGQFLRLFVRSAIEAMGRKVDGELKDKRCLFLLDEFYSLGNISEISKSAGLMPGYGVHLFPILQDLGQLVELYGQDGASTFFGSADAQIFFGNTDPQTLEHISHQMGIRHEASAFGADKEMVGKPFMSPREIRAHVAKKDGNTVARRMIVFAKGDDILSLRVAPHFKERGA